MGYLARLAQVNLISVPTLMGLIETMAVNVHAELQPFAGVRNALLTQWARYCPHCLGQRESWRLGWEVRFADACTHCGHWLLDVCPACGAPQSWRRSALALCHQCGSELSRALSSPAPLAVVRLSQALEASVTDPLVSLDPAPLHGLTVVQRVQLVRLLGAYGAWNGARVPQKIPDADRLHVSWRISTVAAEILCNWPEGFQELFARLRQHAGITDAGRMRGAFGGLYAAIYRGFRSPAFDFLRRAFEEFIEQSWTGAIGRRNRRLDPAVLQRLQWIPAPAARELFGVSPTELKRLIADGRVASVTRRSASGREFELVRKDDVERSRRQSCHYVTLQETAQALGLKRQRLSRLLPRICPEASKDGEAGVPWRIPRSFLDSWRKRLCGYPAVAEVDGERQVTIAERLRFGGSNDEEIVAILTDIEAGTLDVIGVLRGIRQISQVVLRRDALRARKEAKTSGPMTSTLRIQNVAEMLDVKQEVAYCWARAGLLRATIHLEHGRQVLVVHPDALREFAQHYVLGRDIAREHGRSPREVLKRLRLAGVEPVSGPGVDGCRQVVFARAAVTAALSGALFSGR